MTGKEKLDRALAHKSGPVPFDLDSTAVTGLHCTVVAELRRYYGLEEHPVIISDPYQMLGKVEDDLKQAMGVDTAAITGETCMFGMPWGSEKEWRAPWGQVVRMPGDFVTSTDGRDTFVYPCGDTSCPPCAKMPAGGFFFDSIVRGHTYDPDDPHVEDNQADFAVLSDSARAYIQSQLPAALAGGRGLVAQVGGCAIGDIALVPAPGRKDPRGLRDVAEWYMATVADPEYLHEIFAYQTEIALRNLQITHELLGDAVSAVFLCGTDFGTQKGPFCSRETYRSLYMPYYRKMNDWVHKNTGWKTFKHSCGSIRPLLGDIIESGFDIINPVQWSAENMDPRTLKAEFGRDVTFWGGGVNTQKTLPFGTPEQVREEALRMLEIFSADGGFVFNAIHNIQANTPVENVVAMAEAVKEFNGR